MRINGLELRIQKIIRWTLCDELVDSNFVLMDFNSRNNQGNLYAKSMISTHRFKW